MGRSGTLTWRFKNPKIASLETLAARAVGEVLVKQDPEISCSINLVQFFEWDNPDVVLPEKTKDLISRQVDRMVGEEDGEKSIDFSVFYEEYTEKNSFGDHKGWSPCEFVGEYRANSPCTTIAQGERRLGDSRGGTECDFNISEFFKEFWHWIPYWIESCTVVSTWHNEM